MRASGIGFTQNAPNIGAVPRDGGDRDADTPVLWHRLEKISTKRIPISYECTPWVSPERGKGQCCPQGGMRIILRHLLDTTRRQSVVVLTPITPQPTGNGLAMRVARIVESAAGDREVVVVVVPVAGEPLGTATVPGAQRVVRIPPGAGANPRPALIRMLARPAWRDRLRVSGVLPRAARAASPMLADDIFAALGRPSGWAVHVARAGLAPLGVALAELLGAPFATLDLDDDDETLLRGLGEHAEADAHRRLLSAFAGCFSGIWLAAPQEAAAVAARHGVSTAVLPNSVRIPASPRRMPSSPPDLLFVGNLSYRPNVDAATALVERVRPGVRERTGLPITVSVVGDHGGDPRVLSLGRQPGVLVRGFVSDLTELYARASVVVVPMTDAAGTRSSSSRPSRTRFR